MFACWGSKSFDSISSWVTGVRTSSRLSPAAVSSEVWVFTGAECLWVCVEWLVDTRWMFVYG